MCTWSPFNLGAVIELNGSIWRFWRWEVTFHFRNTVANPLSSVALLWLPHSSDIFHSTCSGIFNVPHVTSIYLVKHSAFDAMTFQHKEFDPDMAMCESLRNAVSAKL